MTRQEEKITTMQNEVRSLLEKDYEGVEDYLIENMDSLKEFLEIRKAREIKEERAKENIVEASSKNLDTTIARFLQNIGIPANIKGYWYAKDAIKLYVEKDECSILNITKDVYPVIAEEYNTSDTSVERAIRHAVSTKLDISRLNDYGYSINRTICNTEFLVMAAEIVKELEEISEETPSKQQYTPKIKAVIVPIEISVEKEIDDYLRMMSIPLNIKGYKYLQEAIKLYYSSEISMSDLYEQVAAKFDTVDNRAEKAIRHAVEIGFQRTDYNTIYRIFGNTYSKEKGKVTNSEFIAMIADQIKRN